MSGFADSFVSSFTSAHRQSAKDYTDAVDAQAKADLKAEQDKIKASLGRFTTNRDNWLEQEKKDQEYRRIAMNTVGTYGGKVPDDAWTTIYSELWNGRTIENIREDIDKKGFVVIENTEENNTGTAVDQTEALINGATVALDGTDSKSDVSVSDSLWARQINQESGGKQTDADGNTLESSAGALGISQSLVSTAADPGFGAKSIFELADEAGIAYNTKDETAARNLLADKDLNEAFGKGYMNALLERYDGDEEKALIAYNYGAGNADKYNGDRSTLPEETQGYLKNILGSSDSVGGVVNNSANENQDNWAIFAEDRGNVMKALGISGEMYDRTMKGFMPEFPALKYAWGVEPEDEKDIPDWKVTEKIRKDNYIPFAAAAREAGDETRAIFIETVGGKLVDPAKPPKYLDPINFTTSNAEGYLLAAEHALENATTDEAKTEAQTGIDLVNAYIEKTSDPEEAWYMKGELTESNVAGRIRKATAKGDMKALAYFNAFVQENTKIVPDNVTNAYVASRYAKLALKAAGPDATEDDKSAFNNFKTTDLPILITALRLNTKEGDKPTTLVAAYDALAKAKQNPENTDGIKAAEERVRDILNIEASKEIIGRGSKPIQLIKRIQDESGAYGQFDQITGYIKPDPENPGSSVFVDGDGNVLTDYEELTDSVDKQARAVVSAMSVDIKTYQGNRKQALGAVRLFGDIADLVEQDDRVLTATAGLTIKIDSALRNVSVGLGLFDDLFKKKDDPEAKLTLNEVQMELRDQGILEQGQTLQDLANTDVNTIQLTDNAKGLAQRKAIFEAKMILMTFRAGGLEGQSGQAMSNKDFDRLRQMLTAGGGKEAFLKATQSYVNDRVTAVTDEWTALSENAGMSSFLSRHKYSPLNGDPAAKNITTLMNDANADPRMKAGVDYLSREYTLVNTPEVKAEGAGDGPDLSLSGLGKAYREGKAIVITPEFYEKFKANLGDFKVGDTIQKGAN